MARERKHGKSRFEKTRRTDIRQVRSNVNNTRIMRKIRHKKIVRNRVIMALLLIFLAINMKGIIAYFSSIVTANNIFGLEDYYTITYNNNTGTGTMEKQYVYRNNSTNLTENTFTKENYSFNGWNTQADGSGTSYTDGQSVTITQNTTLYAQWLGNNYEVAFNANGGTGTMENQEILVGQKANLTANEFTRSGYEFTGWNTKADGTGTSYSNEAEVENLAAKGQTITLYAQWKKLPIKYAVQIYGINQDEDESGNKLGLTFGPATNYDVNNAYITHKYEETSSGSGEYYVKIVKHNVKANGKETTSEEYLCKNGGETEKVTRTLSQVTARQNINLHTMTWTEIKNQSTTDPTVFEDCMLCGDTKSVTLTLNSTIASGTKSNQYGDGAGTIYSEINSYYRMWNPSSSDNSAATNGGSYGSNARNAGGYRVSHIRATLIGSDVSNPTIGYAGDVNLDSTNCLYSCIESDLQDVITAKKVKYVTGRSNSDYDTDNTPLLDKIWLFSDKEVYGTGSKSGETTEGLGTIGVAYSKFMNTESKYYIGTGSGYNDSTANRKIYKKAGSASYRWLRSPSLSYGYTVKNVNDSGYIGTNNANDSGFGLAFGFCIEGPSYEVNYNANGGTGTMANQKIAVGQKANLTANEFTREGYKFTGWNTKANGTGKSYSNKAEVENLAEKGQTITLYAQWQKVVEVKYAVQIYGIQQDEDSSGNKLGLTFGPATNYDVNNAYITHKYEETLSGSGEYYVKIVKHNVTDANGTETTEEEYLYKDGGETEKVTRTEAQVNERKDIILHNMSWKKIAEVSKQTENAPNLFEDCMLCGDTKSVTLTLNSTIASGTKSNQYGDGAGMLYDTINSYYRKWNPSKSDNSAATNGGSFGSNAKNAGGYRVSHIRATLIGSDVSNPTIGYAGDVNLDSSNCLYSCIESDLQDVITAKKVKYVTGSSESSYQSNNTPLLDKIWLFSDKEIYGTGAYSGVTTEGIGTDGVAYSKFMNTESKYYIGTGTGSTSSTNKRKIYYKAGSTYDWWLRSPHLNSTYYASYVYRSGYINYGYACDYGDGLAFGFCL